MERLRKSNQRRVGEDRKKSEGPQTSRTRSRERGRGNPFRVTQSVEKTQGESRRVEVTEEVGYNTTGTRVSVTGPSVTTLVSWSDTEGLSVEDEEY